MGARWGCAFVVFRAIAKLHVSFLRCKDTTLSIKVLSLRDKVLLDGVGVNVVIDFRKFPLRRPSQRFLLFFLESLKFLILITVTSVFLPFTF
jgi:hypothetical protein